MSDAPYPRRTERLILRFPRQEDVATLTAYRNDPRVAELQDWDLPYLPEEAEQLVAAHEGRNDLEPGRSAQVMIEHDGRLVGDLYVGREGDGGVAEIGFSLVPEAQGRGLALEAASAVVDDLVDRLGVHRVVAHLSKDNVPSMRLLERLGLRFETLAPRSYWWRGVWDDDLVYAMSGDDRRAWRDRPTGPAEVRLVELGPDNRAGFDGLAPHWSQHAEVGTVAQLYAEALAPVATVGGRLLGVEADGRPAGLLLAGADGRVLRLLVDRWWQDRGVEEAVEALVSDASAPPAAPAPRRG